jgi:hypothetical protein
MRPLGASLESCREAAPLRERGLAALMSRGPEPLTLATRLAGAYREVNTPPRAMRFAPGSRETSLAVEAR